MYTKNGPIFFRKSASFSLFVLITVFCIGIVGFLPRFAQAVGTINVGNKPEFPILVGTNLYVMNYNDGTVSVIDTNPGDAAYNTVIKTITVGPGPKNAVLVGNDLYILNYGSGAGGGTVSVIDTNSADTGTYNTVIATITTGSTSAQPLFATLLGTNLYVVNHGAGTVSVIDTNSSDVGTYNTVTHTITVGSTPEFANIVGNRYLYVPNVASGTVSVIDTNTNTVISTISVGTYPGYYSTPTTLVGGRYLYMLNLRSTNISVIDTTSNTVTATIALPAGAQPGYASALVGSYLYVLDGNDTGGINEVSVINTTSNTVIANLATGPAPEQFILIGTDLYIVNYTGYTLTVIDTTSNTIATTIPVGWCPWYPLQIGNSLYILNPEDNTLSVIDVNPADAAYNTVTDTVAVGGPWPFFSVLSGSNLYVLNSHGTTVSAVNTTRPVLSTAVVSGATLTLNYNESLNASSVPATGYFVVDDNGNPDAVSNVNVAGSSVVLTLATATNPGDTVTVSYAPPILQSTIVSGATITLTYSEPVSTTFPPTTGEFHITDNGTVDVVTNVNVSGSTVVLTLTTSTTLGDTVIVSAPPNPAISPIESDLQAATLSSQTVTTTATLAYAAGSNGTITGTSSQTVNYGSSGTAVTAIPNTGYQFTNWSDNSTNNPRTDYNVTGNMSVIAEFEPIPAGIVSGGYTYPVVYVPIPQIVTTVQPADPILEIGGSMKILKYDMKDPEVTILQEYLNTHGFVIAKTGAGSPGDETNFFGLLTKKAVEKFQSAHGLVPDGIVGPKTRILM